MVCLFEFTLADLDDIGEVFANLVEKLATNVSLSGEQSIQRIGVPGLSR
jgi:hypothetical protein